MQLGMSPAEALVACTVNAPGCWDAAAASAGSRRDTMATWCVLDSDDWRHAPTTWAARSAA
jgi:imidazolonepropionase-like amidohydrolase